MSADTTNGISSVIIQADDPEATRRFLRDAFGLVDLVQVRAAAEPTSEFRGFTLSLVFDQPADVDGAIASALQAGASEIKPAAKSFWGYGGSLRAPDGTVWTLASSSKKNTSAATGQVSKVVLLLGADDVRVTKAFYSDAGLAVGKSFGTKYVEFDTPGAEVTLALQSRRAVAKNAGTDAEGSGSHRLVISGGLGRLVDPDGFTWE
ncbi:glyoxalase [Aeromicrobium sp. CTD01-1L150]|uniref:glyoxalase n=1 Tax=Aeromicrobium sp. CTD01-1L150 TaxID=3341830 RepID=UPI0035C070FD